MIVYAEYVFINNFLIDYLLLKASVTITGSQTCLKRLLICSFLGALFATALPFVQNIKGLSLIKVFVGFTMAFNSCKWYKLNNHLLTVGCFFAVSFFTVGVYLSFSYLLGFSKFSVGLSLLSVLPVVLVVFVIKNYSLSIRRRQKFLSLVYDCKITVGKKVFLTKGFLDTGNRVYLNQKPVIMCAKKISKELCLVANTMDTYALNLTTFNGQREIKAIKNVRVEIYFNGAWHIYKDVAVGLSDRRLEYGLILHNDLFLGEYDAG